jgi:hypothetical protein
MTFIFEVRDKSHRRIHLSFERWKHIRGEHPDIAEPEQVAQVLTQPRYPSGPGDIPSGGRSNPALDSVGVVDALDLKSMIPAIAIRAPVEIDRFHAHQQRQAH